MVETVAVLAGLYGSERQKAAFDALALGLKEDAENGMIGAWKNLFAASGNYQASGEQSRASAMLYLFGNKTAADKLAHASEQSKAAADEESKKALDYFSAQFKALYQELKRRFHDCGFLYAFATIATDGAITIAESAITEGLGKAVIEALKKIKFFVRRLPGRTIEVEIRHGTHTAIEKFTQDELEPKYGKPEENHAGVVTPDENRPIKQGEPKKKLTSKQIGDAAEKQARQDLAGQGYTELRSIENGSGNGIDVIGRNPTTGDVKFLEVKANSASLNDLQQQGGEAYVNRQLDLANSGSGSWASQKDVAREVSGWRDNASNVDYQIWKYDVDPETGVVSNPRHNGWEEKDEKKPKRRLFRKGLGALPPQSPAPSNPNAPPNGPPSPSGSADGSSAP